MSEVQLSQAELGDASGPSVMPIERVDPDLVRLVPPPGGSGRTLIGLAGAPGAGKTTTAVSLARALGPTAVHVPMDGYHLADNVLAAHGTADRKGAPHTFDGWGYLSLLDRIREELDHTVYAPAFERDLEQPIAGSIAIEPEHRTVVSEGNYLLLEDEPWPSIRARFDAVWFVSINQQLRLDRVIARHVQFGKTPEFAAAWVQSNDELNAELVTLSRRNADLILDVTAVTLD